MNQKTVQKTRIFNHDLMVFISSDSHKEDQLLQPGDVLDFLSRVVAVAFHQYGPVPIPEPGAIYGLSCVLEFDSRLAPSVFPGFPVFLPPQKPASPNPNSITIDDPPTKADVAFSLKYCELNSSIELYLHSL